MIYQGSKRRLGKHILPIILEGKDRKTPFYDVFCGGGNLSDQVGDRRVFASDIDPYAIAYLSRLRYTTSGLPQNREEFTEEDYAHVKNNQEQYAPSFLGHVGYNLSFGGKWHSLAQRKEILQDETGKGRKLKVIIKSDGILTENNGFLFYDHVFLKRKQAELNAKLLTFKNT